MSLIHYGSWGSAVTLKEIQAFDKQRRQQVPHARLDLWEREIARALAHVVDGHWSIERYEHWYAQFTEGRGIVPPKVGKRNSYRGDLKDPAHVEEYRAQRARYWRERYLEGRAALEPV